MRKKDEKDCFGAEGPPPNVRAAVKAFLETPVPAEEAVLINRGYGYIVYEPKTLNYGHVMDIMADLLQLTATSAKHMEEQLEQMMAERQPTPLKDVGDEFEKMSETILQARAFAALNESLHQLGADGKIPFSDMEQHKIILRESPTSFEGAIALARQEREVLNHQQEHYPQAHIADGLPEVEALIKVLEKQMLPQIVALKNTARGRGLVDDDKE